MAVMARKKSNKRLLAKAVSMVYGFPGTLMQGWEARPLGEDRYEILRSCGTKRIIRIGEQIMVREPESKRPTPSIVSRSETGALMVGNLSVIIGKDIRHGYQARQLAREAGNSNRPLSYLILSDRNRQVGRVTIGQDFEGKCVSLVDGHLLRVGDDIIPITPKIRDITLLVMASPRDGGYMSYINVIEPGNTMNRNDGAAGSLIPPKNKGEPAIFIENFAGKRVTTARFWVDSAGKKLTYQFRDAETALKEQTIQEELSGIRNLAIETGLEPEELAEFAEAQKKLDLINQAWEGSDMALLQGQRIFEPHNIQDELEANGVGLEV